MLRIAKILGTLALTIPAILGTGCLETPCGGDCEPPAPSGVYSITGDGYVEILWDDLHIANLDYYRVYWSYNETGFYEYLGSSDDPWFLDTDVSNGVTYYYAVSAVSTEGYESELSYETVFDTPRPAGEDLVVGDTDEESGVDFSGYYQDMITAWDDIDADMYLYWYDGQYWMASTDRDLYGTDIQYAGYVESLDEIDWAPDGGWTEDEADNVVLHEDHAYLVWTWDNHFAAFWVREIGLNHVILDWVYQLDEGNPELLIMGTETGSLPRIGKAPRNPDMPPVKPAQRSSRPILSEMR
ncbi:MAG: hypothetical protein QGG80_05830 [Candidatus Krumholzibacteria bacterium]|jgi:hypothetical protein|nr:hypothetical protein [Candidatus Krumholzibacteria bacterium]